MSPTAETAALIQLSLSRPGKSAVILATEPSLTVPPSGTAPLRAYVHPIDYRTFLLLSFSVSAEKHAANGNLTVKLFPDGMEMIMLGEFGEYHIAEFLGCN